MASTHRAVEAALNAEEVSAGSTIRTPPRAKGLGEFRGMMDRTPSRTRMEFTVKNFDNTLLFLYS